MKLSLSNEEALDLYVHLCNTTDATVYQLADRLRNIVLMMMNEKRFDNVMNHYNAKIDALSNKTNKEKHMTATIETLTEQLLKLEEQIAQTAEHDIVEQLQREKAELLKHLLNARKMVNENKTLLKG